MNLVALAPFDQEDVLREEVGSRLIEQHGRLFLLKGNKSPHFAQNVWLKPEIFKFDSISQAAKQLRGVQRNWWLHSIENHRRAKLIQEQLPPIKQKPIDFLSPLPTSPLGSWTLLDDKTLLYSAECTSPFPDGEVIFNENKTGPPSRAYLKLWEFFTLSGRYPKAGEKVLDLGSSPGGWTWVLDQLGCEVVSVDKAPLSAATKFSPKVHYKNESAFGLDPSAIGKVDWLFSDVICYPERLLELVKKWQPYASNMVCSIKFQGPTNFAVIEEFLKIPGSSVRHLFNNKHELTFSLLAQP